MNAIMAYARSMKRKSGGAKKKKSSNVSAVRKVALAGSPNYPYKKTSSAEAKKKKMKRGKKKY